MKRILLALAILLCASPCFAQLVLTANLAGQVSAPIDQNGWQSFKVTLTQNITFSFVILPLGTPPPAQSTLRVIFVQDAVGGRTVTFAANISNPCTISGTSLSITICQFAFDNPSSTWIGISGGSSDPQGGGTSTSPASVCNGYLVKQGDFLIQNSTGNTVGATYTLTWRMILTTGERKEFQQSGLTSSSSNGPAYNSFPLVEGCLVGGSLTLLGGGVDSGQTYSQVFLGRNFAQVPNSSSIQLVGCSFGSNYSVGWNGVSAPSCRTSTDGQGYNQTITFANPAAGANLVNGALSGGTIIGQKHWLANVRFTLTTNATAQARQACITFKDAGGNVVYGNCIQGTQAASLIVNYDFTAGVGAQYPGAATLIVIPSTNVAATANEVQSTLPSNFQFSDASTISITIIGIQTGDQLSNIVVRTFWSHHVTD